MWKSVANWFGSYLYFSKATLCIRGLIFSHSFVNHLVVSALMAYGQEIIEESSMAAVATNIINGVSSIMVCFLAYISNTVGPFKVIAFTNAAYFLGLLIFWIFDEPMVICGAVLLVALGEAGRPASLGRFLEDQYSRETDDFKSPEKQNNPEAEEDHTSTRKEEEEEDDKRKCALWSHPWFLGAAVTLGFIKRFDGTQLLLSTIAMGVGYSLFWYGVFSYSRKNSPAAEATHGDQGLFQAIKRLSPPKEEARWRFWLKPKSGSRKSYYKEMLVMCLAFIAYSLVEATGSTLFFAQVTKLLRKKHMENPAVTYFVILQSLSSSIISFLWSLLVPNRSKRATLVRIGCGLVCSVLCMVVAWRVEIHTSKSGNGYWITLVWFIPQFCLLGCMRGLAIDGLIVFFADRVDDNDNGKRKAKYYGTYASELVLGSGTLLIALSILGFRGMLKTVDLYYKYYRALAFIGGANLCYYFCVAFYFYTKEDNVQTDPSNKDKDQHVSSGGAGSHENPVMECCNKLISQAWA
ncbi:hypothetical protein ABKV19_025177 [Rosa sericea]